MKLSEKGIQAAKPREKEYLLNDGDGLNLRVMPDGRKYWALRYTIEGKARRISLGRYPLVTLKEARAERESAKKLLNAGIDPAEHKKQLLVEEESSIRFTHAHLITTFISAPA